MERDINSKIYIENVEKGSFGSEPLLPNSIPLISNFVGRADYLNVLRESYRKGSRSFVLHGIGGVGKSATALRFAGEIADEYTARIFVDMQGLKNPLSTREAMLNIVRQFEREVPADISDALLKSLYVSKVQHQPTLFVLDNAADAAQIAPLINLKDACFIVSSRNYIDLTAGKTVRINAMSPEDAKELLFKVADGEEKFEGRAGELAKMAGYLPMALKPLAKLLKNKFKTIADILRDYADKKRILELTDHDHDNLSVEASFALSYDALPPEMQQHWRRLSVFPADFEKQAASTVFGTEFEEGEAILLQLYDYSLIEEDSTSTNEEWRFNIHDLAREFANKQLLDEERFNAQLRHSLYYSLILRIANNVESNDSKNGFINALKLIDKEWANILSGQDWAARFLDKDDDAAELCADYAGLVTDLLSLRLTPREEIIWFKAGLAAARKFQNPQAEGFFLNNIGNAKIDLGEYEDAFQHLNQALKIAQDQKDIRNEIAVLNNLGKFFGIENNKQKSCRKSANYSKRALKIAVQLNDRKAQCVSFTNLATAFQGYYERYESLKKRIKRTRPLWWYQKSLTYSGYAMTIADESGYQEIASAARSNMGRVFLVVRDFKKAKKYFEEALEIQRKIKNSFGIALCLTNLASAYLGLRKKEKACNLWKEALIIFETVQSPYADQVRVWIKGNCETLK